MTNLNATDPDRLRGGGAYPPHSGGVVNTTGAAGFRVIYHPLVCPDCGSGRITEEDIDTGEGLTETALCCRACGACWQVACVTEWGGRS